MEHQAGYFNKEDDNNANAPQQQPDDSALPYVNDFNWASTTGDFDTIQYQYLTSAVFENYSMHLRSRRQPGMCKEDFVRYVRLLYQNVPLQTGNALRVPDTTLGPDDEGSTSMKHKPDTSDVHAQWIKQEPDTSDVHAQSTNVLSDFASPAGPTPPAPGATTRENAYREQREELKRLVSTVLYLTEMYNVAQTRGGAQVSQYRRTLTAQSHTMLVQRLARKLQQTEAGFWAWLHARATPTAGTTMHV